MVDEFLENLSHTIEYQEYEIEMKEIHGKINKAEIKRNQLIDLLLDNKIDKIIYDKKFEILSNEIVELQTSLEMISKSSEVGLDIKQRLQNFKKIFDRKEPLEKFDGDLFKTVMEKVVIGSEDKDGNPMPYSINFIFKTGLEIKVRPMFENEKEGLSDDEPLNEKTANLAENSDKKSHEDTHARRSDNNDDIGLKPSVYQGLEGVKTAKFEPPKNAVLTDDIGCFEKGR